MNINEIIQALIGSSLTVVIVAVLLWLVRNYISSWVSQRIKFKYDKELEELRASIRKTEDAQNFIQQAVMTAFSVNDSTVKTYRLNAIDKLWRSFLSVKNHSGYVKTIATLNIDNLSAMISDPKIKELIDALVPDIEILKAILMPGPYIEGEASRIWISPVVWALYSAYATTVFYSVSQLFVLKLGESVTKLITTEKILTMLSTAMPDIEVASISNNKLPLYLEILEQKLADELHNDISNHEPNLESIKRAKVVIDMCAEMNFAISRTDNTSDSK